MKCNVTNDNQTRQLTGAIPMALAAALALAISGPASAERDNSNNEMIHAEWSNGVLRVTGTSRNDDVIIASNDGLILVNNGLIPVIGGTATIQNTSTIYALGLDGNDQIALNEFNGALPNAVLLGGSGNDLLRGGSNDDILFGGSGNDVLIGDEGRDTLEGQDGSDLLIVNNGDGSDFLEGGEGNDTVQVNGASFDRDVFLVSANDNRVLIESEGDSHFILDVGSTETVKVYGHGGDDEIRSTGSLADLTNLDLDGGEGNDLLIGSDGADVLRGGAGNDTLLGNRGNDVVLGQDGNDLLIVNNGDGSDFLEGGAGNDIVQVNGADGAGDDFSIDPNGERVIVRRNNLDVFSADIGSAETLDVNGQGGSDVIIGSVGLNGLISLHIDGGKGNDILLGGDGNDVMDGSLGEDFCDGNGGRDKFRSCELWPES